MLAMVLTTATWGGGCGASRYEEDPACPGDRGDAICVALRVWCPAAADAFRIEGLGDTTEHACTADPNKPTIVVFAPPPGTYSVTVSAGAVTSGAQSIEVQPSDGIGLAFDLREGA